jgi:ADP-ribose pyrophosphatase YjhB (NUDIX family)
VHCPHCGSPLGALALSHAGHASCLACREVEWRGPLPVAGVLVVRDGRVLLVRRSAAMERSPGRWAYPGGFVEAGETLEQAALRETLEEAGLHARITGIVGRPHTLLDPHHAVFAFRGEAAGEPAPGDEADEVRWFAPREIPWDEIAFPSTEVALRALVEEIGGQPAHPHQPPASLDRAERALVRHCRRCGSALRPPLEGELGHAVCSGCAAPCWSNPAVGASLLTIRDRRVLLGRRAAPGRPGFGRWAAPAGYVDPGESTEDAALRELYEETGARARVTGLLTLFSQTSHVEACYVGESDDEPRPTAEMSELRWFSRDELPWPDLFDTCPTAVRLLIERNLI